MNEIIFLERVFDWLHVEVEARDGGRIASIIVGDQRVTLTIQQLARLGSAISRATAAHDADMAMPEGLEAF